MSYLHDVCGKHAPRPHNEYFCHGTGEQRDKIIKEIKRKLKGFNNRQCVLEENQPHTGHKKAPAVNVPSELVNHKAPLITYTGVQEYRLTCDPTRVADDPPDLFYKAAPNLHKTRVPLNTLGRKKSVELKGGVFYGSCFCVKRNGLQGDCPRSDCLGRPECLAISPGPCCEPALAYFGKSTTENAPKEERSKQCQYIEQKCCCCHKC